jgi:hypothetical protein
MKKEMNKKIRMNKRGMVALSQVIILIVGIIAIGYALGSEMGEVSGESAESACYTNCQSEFSNFRSCYSQCMTVQSAKVQSAKETVAESSQKLSTDYLPPKNSLSTTQTGTGAGNRKSDGRLKYSYETMGGDFYFDGKGSKIVEGQKYTFEGRKYLRKDGSWYVKHADGTTEQIADQNLQSTLENEFKAGSNTIITNPVSGITSTPVISCSNSKPGDFCNDGTNWRYKKADGTLSDDPIQTAKGNLGDGKVTAGVGGLTAVSNLGFFGDYKGQKMDIQLTDAGKNTYGSAWLEGTTIVSSTDTTVTIKTADGTEKMLQKSEIADANLAGGKELLGNLGTGFKWALGLYAGAQTILPLLGFYPEVTKSISLGLLGGTLAGYSTFALLQHFNSAQGIGGVSNTAIGAGVGIGVGAAIAVATYKEESKKIVQYTCRPREAPEKGKDCTKCNNQGEGIPCSEYQCKSLGQSCQLLNPGTGEEACEWVNRNDVVFPTITPNKNVLTVGYDYTPDNKVSPPDKGVNIICTSNECKTDKKTCIEPFVPLEFGFDTNEPAVCKVDTKKAKDFENMTHYFGGSLYKYNHTEIMNLPGANAKDEKLNAENDRQYELYVRCKDANGNYNPANFVFKFETCAGPDTSPPLIVTTDLLNNMPIASGTTGLNMKIYVNDRSDSMECKWDHSDKSYGEMLNNGGTCKISTGNPIKFECPVTLEGLKDGEENKFYFRCNDSINTNKESFVYTIIGTKPLVITSVIPNDTTIKDSTLSIKVPFAVKTFAGYEEGKATCSYKDKNNVNAKYVVFENTLSHEHTNDVYLTAGNYEYLIRCIDLGGNSAVTEINFTVESDAVPPITVRFYHEEPYLKIITDEISECVYNTADNNGCTYFFKDGISMTALDDKKTHYTDWNTKATFYVKCRDIYGKEPNPDQCSIIVKPFEESPKTKEA